MPWFPHPPASAFYPFLCFHPPERRLTVEEEAVLPYAATQAGGGKPPAAKARKHMGVEWPDMAGAGSALP